MIIILHKVRGAAAMLIALLVCSCGTTGKTSHGVVALDNLPKSQQLRSVLLDSIEREDAGIHLVNIGVQPWGKFDDTDQENIRLSIEDTLKGAMRGRSADAEQPIKLHILIRKYVVGASTNEAAVWAHVDWCAADGKNKILFSEAFYATATADLFGSLSGVKDRVNRAIVKRIAQAAVTLAANSKPTESGIAGTYTTFEDAAETMPAMLETWGSSFYIFVVPLTATLVGRNESTKSPSHSSSADANIDWAIRLAKRR